MPYARPIIVVLAALLTVAGCRTAAPAGGQVEPSSETTEKAETVGLRFDWPAETRLRAEAVHRTKRPGSQPVETRFSYEVRAAEAEEGDGEEAEDRIRVDISPTFEGRGARTVAGSAMPGFRVEQTGAYATAMEVDAVRADYLERLKTDGKAVPMPVKRLLDPTSLRQRSRQWWSSTVGLWSGREFEIGERYSAQVEDTFQLPMAGSRSLEMEVDFGVDERVACEEPAAEEEPGCIRATMSSKPDVDQLADWMQQLVDRASARQAKKQGMAKAPKIEVVNIYLQTDTTLVTDPETLLPRRLTEKQTIRLRLRAPDGTERAFKRVDTTETAFTVVN